MVYRGHVQNGVIVVDEAVMLPEGAEVRVEVATIANPQTSGEATKTLYDQLGPLIGAAKGLPPDLARNHDLYLHGQIKG